ncbi:MAG: M48 family metalloprotease, partial [Dinoroseobacter sp.]|nr:M48 family metalloprotease [Dinoroseobacter sp.]
LAERQQEAQLGAMAGGILASILTSGSSAAGGEIIDQAMQAGAFVGARAYSKDKELEADALGTVITARAGYDPVRGAAFFSRIPDPGDQFLGTHPPNAERIQVVRQVAAGL